MMLCEGNSRSMSSSLSHIDVLLVKVFWTLGEIVLSRNSRRILTVMVSLVAKLPCTWILGLKLEIVSGLSWNSRVSPYSPFTPTWMPRFSCLKTAPVPEIHMLKGL